MKYLVIIAAALMLVACGEDESKTDSGAGGIISVQNHGGGTVNIQADNLDVVDVQTSDESTATVEQGVSEPTIVEVPEAPCTDSPETCAGL